MAIDLLRDQISRHAHAVHDAAEKIKDGFETQRERETLEAELDQLFSELGVEVYQRIRRGDPIQDAVVVQDLVDRITEIEERLTRDASRSA